MRKLVIRQRGVLMVFGLGKPNIEKMEKNEDVKGLIKALKYKKDSLIRTHAADALGDIGDTRAVDPLIKSLNDEDWQVRWGAAEALGNIGDARAVEPLINTLKDKDDSVRKRVVMALGRIGDVQAVDPLKKALKDTNSIVIRDTAADSLDKIGWKPTGDEELVIYLIAKGNWIEVVQIGKPAIKPIIESLEYVYDEDKDLAARALYNIGENAVEPLIGALKNANKDIRDGALVALDNFDDPRAVDAIKNYEEDQRVSAEIPTVCDICSRGVNPSDCYALTTREVTTNYKYWLYMLETNTTFDDELLAMAVQQQAMQQSGWLVCESCSDMFDFDKNLARDYARRMVDPPGSGPVDVQDAAVAAAAAWKAKHGNLPSWVRQ